MKGSVWRGDAWAATLVQQTVSRLSLHRSIYVGWIKGVNSHIRITTQAESALSNSGHRTWLGGWNPWQTTSSQLSELTSPKGKAWLPYGTRVERFFVFTARNSPNNKNWKQSPQHTLFFGVVQEVTGGEVRRGGVSFRSHFTPAKGQNFPKASRYLFLIVSIQRISVTKFKCPEHRIHTQNIKTAFLFFLFRKLETLLL